jgi:hypothetical protein
MEILGQKTRRLTKREMGQTQLTLPELYEMTDEALADLPKPPCAKRECNGCCWSPPTITDAEFVHIRDHINISEIKPATEPWCRFYEESTGGCRIYPVRPLECRLVAVLDTYRFGCCAPAAQPELMPKWAPLLREALYRMLYVINGGASEVHINVLFDQAYKESAGRSPTHPATQHPMQARITRALLTFSFWLVRIARRLERRHPPSVKAAE